MSNSCEKVITPCVKEEGEGPASFSARLMALVIDSSLLGMVYSVGIFLAGYNVLDLLDGEIQVLLDFSVLFSAFVLFGPVLIGMSYFTVLFACGGKTIGKAIMGIKVVAVSGATLGYWRSWLRWVGYHISALPFLAGFLWVVLDAHRRSWHDILVRSKVVNDKIS